MRIGSISFLAVVVLGATSSAPAQAALECPVSGVPSSWGVQSTGYFGVASGGTRLFPVKMDGVIATSTISQKPAHGTRHTKEAQRLDIHIYSEAGIQGQ